MKLPSFTRLVVEDFPSEVQKWIDKLVTPLNSFMLSVRTGMDKNLTVNENLSGAIQSLTVSSSDGSTMSTSIRYVSSRNPKVVILGYWRNKTDSSWVPANDGISLKWSYDGKSKLSLTFYGLNAAHTYSINLLILDD